MDYQPFEITLKLALWTTATLLIIGIPIAYAISYSKWKVRYVFESVFMLPIILPPTVLGYYYISMLGPNSAVGSFLYDNFNINLTFTFQGILVGSIIYCLPFMISPLVNGFRSVPKNLIESAKVIGKSKWSILWNVLLPYIKSSVWNGLLLTFAHTIGEFGVVLMIGGNLPETRVASIAIYDEMNKLDFANANSYAIILLAISFGLIFLLTLVSRKTRSGIA